MKNEIALIKRQVMIEEWAKRIHDCRSSGLTNKEWCRQNNISTAQYYKWLRIVREWSLNNQSAESPVVEIQMPDPVPTSSPITIRMTDREIAIQNNANPELVSLLLSSL